MKPVEIKKKVLILSSNPEYSFAGDGRNAFLWATHLSFKFRAVFVTLNFEGTYKGPDINGGVEIERVSYFNRNLFQKIYSRTLFIIRFIRLIFSVELVLIYGKILGNKTIIFLSWILGKKVIFRSTLYGFDDFSSLTKDSFILGAYQKFIYSLVWGYHALSPAFSSSYLKIFNTREKVFESCQGVNTQFYYPLSLEEKRRLRNIKNIPLNVPVILSVGPLLQRKGIIELIQALSQMDLAYIYMVLGDYQVEDNHYLYKNKNEINQNIELGKKLLGDKLWLIQSKEDIKDYYQLSDLFIMNSSQEGLPNSLLEAMASGLPSIVKKIPGLENFICFDRENCLLYENINKVPTLILELLNDVRLSSKISENSAKIAGSRLDIRTIVRNFIDHFNL